ncbi:MAG TPA: hypothetical protein VEA15_10690 [Caulobacteraceae bacterium]|nr:hypothetical protein [Caulobacteraceae bacterium]
MKRTALYLSLLLAAGSAAAQPAGVADVRVTIGPELQEKAKDYGERDLQRLAADLEADVEKALVARGRLGGGARLDLVLTDARPSRPTFEQMAQRPGLDMRSVSNGGATIEGEEIGPDGQRRPVSFSWYESDIRWAGAKSVWTDAEHAFGRFARQYAEGKR